MGRNEEKDWRLWGHSANSFRSEPLSEHLEETKRYASLFGERLGMGPEAILTALLHDVGKMGVFQKKLRGHHLHADHWSFGAQMAYQIWKDQGKKSQGMAAALAIAGHHTGLGNFTRDFRERLRNELPMTENGREISKPDSGKDDLDELLKRLSVDPRTMPLPEESTADWNRRNEKKNAALMLDLRFLYSILVDADFLATEGHFSGTPDSPYYHRPISPTLEPEKLFEKVMRHLERLHAKMDASSENVRTLRDSLLVDSLAAADEPIGTFTMTAPTGAGKTLAMLAFALKHAMKHRLERIIVVIPFLSIIEQTAEIYRRVLLDGSADDSPTGAPIILEDHSRARNGGETRKTDRVESLENLMAENWDAPIVITTNIQFFESLHSNRSAACRKLHRLARSVILMDEVQSFPKELALPTLGTLSRLPERYQTTLVMATATQPAFTEFDDALRKERLASGWNPREIVGLGSKDPDAVPRLFQRAQRTKVQFWNKGRPTPWSELARGMADQKRALAVVNLKRHATRLIDELTAILPHEGDGPPKGLYHLSTNMCPKHREDVLNTVRKALDTPGDEPVLLVATQCIEAGVDVDFPVGWRAMGPLDAVAQAAGRVNRNQKNVEIADFYLFYPERETEKERLYPFGYGQGASVFESIMKTFYKDSPVVPIEEPAIYLKYYKDLYQVSGVTTPSVGGGRESVLDGMKSLDFPQTAKCYRLIREDTINVLVPYAPNRVEFDALVKEVEEKGLSADWMRRARDWTVGVYRTGQEAFDGCLHPIPLRDWTGRIDLENGPFSSDWFYLIPDESDDPDRARYEGLKGLCGKQGDFLFA